MCAVPQMFLLLAALLAIGVQIIAGDTQSYVYPELYDLNLSLVKEDGNYSGHLTIMFKALKDADRLILDVHPEVYVTDIQVGRDETMRPAESVSVDAENMSMTVKPKSALHAGKHYQLSADFQGSLRNNSARGGAFRFEDPNDANGTWWYGMLLAWGGAKEVFPCWDQVELRSRFRVSLWRNSNQKALTNMPLERTIRTKDSKIVKDRFEVSLPMIARQLTVVISEGLAPVVSDEEETYGKLQVWSRSGQSGKDPQLLFAARAAAAALNETEKWTLVPYSPSKLDIVEIPSGAPQSSSWGLSVQAAGALQVPEAANASRITQERVILQAVAIVAGQWSTGELFVRSVRDSWLNEGLRIFLQYDIADKVRPSWGLLDRELWSIHEVMNQDTEQDVDSLSEAIDSSHRAAKGAALLRMMESAFTSQVFQVAVQRFLTIKHLSSASPANLWRNLQVVAEKAGTLAPLNATVAEAAKTWVIQPGLPVINVIRNYDAGLVTFSQKRFMWMSSEEGRWWVPLTWTDGKTGNFESSQAAAWLPPSSSVNVSVSIPSDAWIFVNVRHTGLYRVNYDTRNWLMLTRTLHSYDFNWIPAKCRALLISDAMALARSGRLNYAVALDLLSYLSTEMDLMPWQAADEALGFLDNRLQDTDAHPLLLKFVSVRVSLLYRRGGIAGDGTASQSEQHRLLRPIAVRIACHVGVPECIKDAPTLLTDWMNGKRAIDSDIVKEVMCAGVFHSESNWEDLWKNSTNDPNFLRALVCTSSSENIQKLLNRTLSPSTDVKLAVEVLESLVNFPPAFNSTLDYLDKNFSKVLNKIESPTRAAHLLTILANAANTEARLEKVRALATREEASLGAAAADVRTALTKAAEALVWSQLFYDSVNDWLVGITDVIEPTTSTNSVTSATNDPGTGTTPSTNSTSVGGSGTINAVSSSPVIITTFILSYIYHQLL